MHLRYVFCVSPARSTEKFHIILTANGGDFSNSTYWLEFLKTMSFVLCELQTETLYVTSRLDAPMVYLNFKILAQAVPSPLYLIIQPSEASNSVLLYNLYNIE